MNSTQKNILKLLNTGSVISGEEIAHVLNLSRGGVWKAIKGLKELGFDISSVSNQGYRMQDRLEFFDPEKFKVSLEAQLNQPFDLIYRDVVDSTNDVAMAHIEPGSWTVVVAESQASGRGRRGRTWESPFGKHLYLSLGFWQAQSIAPLQGASLVAGLALLRVLRGLGLEKAGLKWPNDLWVDEKKCAGILVDIKGEANYGFNVVLGVGINVYEDSALAGLNAISLQEVLPIGKQELAQHLVPALIEAICELRVKGFSHYRPEYNQAHIFHERTVKIEGHAEIASAEVAGVAEDGGLWVDCDGDSTCLYSADISIFG